MQYGLDIFPYKRIKENNNVHKRGNLVNYKVILSYCGYFLVSLLISRVELINGMAPFGIAFLLTIITYSENKRCLISGVGSILGYISIRSTIDNEFMYIIIVVSILCIKYICSKYTKYSRKKFLLIISGTIFLEFFINSIFLKGFDLSIAVMSSILEMVCLIPLFFILNLGVEAFEKINTKYTYNNEELISMGIIVALITSGTWGVAIYGISIMSILGLMVTLMIAYAFGSSVGAATGVAMGAIMGMSVTNTNMLIYISMYGVCGLIVGIFKDAGKWMSVAAYFVTFLIFQLYIDDISQFKIIEGIIGGILFIIISISISKIISVDLSKEYKKTKSYDANDSNIRYLYNKKLEGFSDVLFNLSSILNDLAENDRLALKTKSTEMVEKLADRVCADCDMNSICWKRELHYTYSAFTELIGNFQIKKYSIPDEINNKCIRRSMLIKNTEQIVNRFVMDEIHKKSLSEGRELVSNQIRSIADYIKVVNDSVSENTILNNSLEKKIRYALDKEHFDYENIICYEDKNGKLKMKLSMKQVQNNQELLKIINDNCNQKMWYVNHRINHEMNHEGNYNLALEEMPKYDIETYAVGKCKEGEKFSGDSYNFSNLENGKYMVVISDGMGSGPQASRESKAAIEVIKSYTSVGLSNITAIEAVNSMMSIKFSEEEKFTTVDLFSADLYTGESEFVKVGAVASFIKSKNDVEVIKSKTLPIGVLDKVDIEINKKQIKDGDFIIMLSDGALDYNDDNIGNDIWVAEYLKGIDSDSPKEIAQGILNEIVKYSKYRVKDDITIVVSKVQRLIY